MNSPKVAVEFETNVEDLDSEAGSDFWLVRFLYKNKKETNGYWLLVNGKKSRVQVY